MLLAWDRERDCEDLTPTVADAVFGVAAPARVNSNRPRLGLLLDDDNGAVRVTDVTKNSIAESTGIRKDDLIIELAGIAVQHAADVSKLVQRQAPGTWLPITLKRGDQTIEVVAKFPPQK